MDWAARGLCLFVNQASRRSGQRLADIFQNFPATADPLFRHIPQPNL